MRGIILGVVLYCMIVSMIQVPLLSLSMLGIGIVLGIIADTVERKLRKRRCERHFEGL